MDIELIDNDKGGIDLSIKNTTSETGKIEDSYLFWQTIKATADIAIKELDNQR